MSVERKSAKRRRDISLATFERERLFTDAPTCPVPRSSLTCPQKRDIAKLFPRRDPRYSGALIMLALTWREFMSGRRIAGTLAPLVAAGFAVALLGTGEGVARAEEAGAPTSSASGAPKEGFQLELGLFGGVHVFASNLELGVADDPRNVPHPQ